LVEFALTSDLDWSSEHCVESLLAIAERFSIKPTIFVTHKSAAVRQAARDGRVELGIHPNFLPGSTHGDSIEAIIAHVLALAPEATAVRCHRHFTSPEIERALAAHGLRIDGNTHHHLARGLAPITLPSGLLRLAVFFEDDCHWVQHETWRFRDHAAEFFRPGLKVLNFHPFLIALNAPTDAFYLRHKRHIQTLTAADARQFRHAGEGAATFLLEAIRAIKEAGHRFVTLAEMADGFLRSESEPAARLASSAPEALVPSRSIA
jgi:hypothetical protein